MVGEKRLKVVFCPCEGFLSRLIRDRPVSSSLNDVFFLKTQLGLKLHFSQIHQLLPASDTLRPTEYT